MTSPRLRVSAVRSSAGRDWLVVAACLACQIGMGAGGYIFPVFLKPVTDELGWSRAQYAFATPIMSTTVALAGPLVGWVSDRRGPRWVLAVGSLLMSAALMRAGAIQTPDDLYLVGVAIGVAVACLGDLPTGAAVTARFRQRRGLALGVVYIGSNIGGALVPLAGALLVAGASWRTAFVVIGAALLVILPLALSIGPAQTVASEETDTGAWHAVARQRDFWLLFWVLFAFYFYRLGINTHLVAFLGDLGYSSLAAAGGFSLTLALGIVGKLATGAIADRVGARAAVLGNFSLIALASLLLLAPMVGGALPLFLVVHGFATAAEDVVIPLVIAQRFGAAQLGRVYGLLLLALVPGGWAGPLVAGWVFDVTGSYAPVFAAFAVTNLSAVAALALVGRPTLRARDLA
ncbi:MAG: MFS transporter [Deltaproteobacteria bacterium]|nr:MFS transporter [Deltaproteobacteria bacterium]